MNQILWEPSQEFMQHTNIKQFMSYAEARYGRFFPNYPALYDWSVEYPEEFWAACWSFFQTKASAPYESVLVDGNKMPGAVWFHGAKMNYAENLLRLHERDDVALIFCNEDGQHRSYSHKQLYEETIRLADALKKQGVRKGDVVAAFMPNIPETVIAMLAAVSLGAIWTSCATALGAQAVIDKLGQLSPKVLFTADAYIYKGKIYDVIEKAAEVQRTLHAQTVVVTHYYGEQESLSAISNSMCWENFISPVLPEQFVFEQVEAEAPLFIMFSSGTTGKPKCMVHSHVGVFLNQQKELLLQNNVKPGDRVMYVTTCSWMMWNWQLGTLATGAALVLFDGNPNYPDMSALWKVVDKLGITLLGISASYIHMLMKEQFRPAECAKLSSLRCISQTGSALSPEGFVYIYEYIKKDVHFSSISGGTDINGSFISGNPLMPVRKGELQMPALGMCVACYNEDGKAVWDEQGELVCTKPVPTMPLYFMNDPDGIKYRSAYFSRYPGVWCHGDYVMFHSQTRGVSFYGRSDAVLKPSGVRIGTSEIYNIVNTIPGIEDSLAVGQQYHADQRVVLFVKLRPDRKLDNALKQVIRAKLRTEASVRHVPALIFACPDVPRTRNGKKVESAVSNILNHRPVSNTAALENPEVLEFYRKLSEMEI